MKVKAKRKRKYVYKARSVPRDEYNLVYKNDAGTLVRVQRLKPEYRYRTEYGAEYGRTAFNNLFKYVGRTNGPKAVKL